MKIIVLGKKDFGEKNDPALLADAIGRGQGIEARVVYWEDLLIHVAGTNLSIRDTVSGEELAECDLVVAVGWFQGLYRDLAFTVARYLEAKNVRCWNSEMIKQRSTSKLSTIAILALSGLPVPETYFAVYGKTLKSGLASLSYPVIIKHVASSRGRKNYREQSEKEARQRLEGIKWYMLQEYIPNKSDLRLWVFGGKAVLALRRTRQNDLTHLNNTAQGAKAELVEIADLSSSLIKAAETSTHLLHREVAGVDVINDEAEDNFVIFEVNVFPQLTSGSFVPHKLSLLRDSIKEFVESDIKEARR